MKIIVPKIPATPERVLVNIGDMLKFVRLHNEWSRKQVSEMIATALPTYRSWEDKTRQPSPTIMEFLERFVEENIPKKFIVK